MNFAPSVCEHGARLIGCTPWETSRDADLLFAGQAAARAPHASAPADAAGGGRARRIASQR
jgi:hypothetical protein